MNKLITFLSGKKTFIVAILMVALGLLQGDEKLVLEGLAFGFLRLGVSKQ